MSGDFALRSRAMHGSSSRQLISGYLLGLRWTNDGYSSWIIDPLVFGFDFKWAEYSVTTPAGEITAGWNVTAQTVVLTIRGPSGTSGTVVLPFAVDNCVVNGVHTKTNGTETIRVTGGEETTIVLNY
jgi:hypothetical protein